MMTLRRSAAVFVVVTLSTGVGARIAYRPTREEARTVGQQCTLKVDGMACGACANRVQKVATRVGGVIEAVVSHQRGTATITYDPAKTTPLAIAKAITDGAGFASDVTR